MSSGNEYSIGAIIPICCAINGPKGCVDSQRDMPIRTTRHPTLTLLESDLALLFAIPFQEDLSRALGSHAGSLTPQCGQERADANTPLPHSQHLTCSIVRLNLWSGFWGQSQSGPVLNQAQSLPFRRLSSILARYWHEYEPFCHVNDISIAYHYMQTSIAERTEVKNTCSKIYA